MKSSLADPASWPSAFTSASRKLGANLAGHVASSSARDEGDPDGPHEPVPRERFVWCSSFRLWGLGFSLELGFPEGPLGPKRPSPVWFWWPNSIMVVYMDPLGFIGFRGGLGLLGCRVWRNQPETRHLQHPAPSVLGLQLLPKCQPHSSIRDVLKL